MNTPFQFRVWLVVAVACFAMGCGDDEPSSPSTPINQPGAPGEVTGPINGNWRLSSVTCDGTTIPIFADEVAAQLQVSGPSGTLSLSEGDACSVSFPLAITYNTDQVSFTPSAAGCTPADCSEVCGTNALEAETLRYEVSGNELRMTKTAEIQDQACPPGQTMTQTFTRQ